MAVDKELEIKLQFLDEADEYLQTLDGALLDLAHKGVLQDDINAALRASHSIKGGAAMMGYTLLSEFAHRLEDSLKVLKIQRDGLVIDDNLERLLLLAVDVLRRVIQCDRTQNGPEDVWLSDTAMPVFDQLHEILGEADPEDANLLLSSDENQDIIPVLFSTEVEGCLVRLESAIASNTPQLREEVMILAQELGGLGEMLQLSSFYELCIFVEQSIQAADDTQVMEVAQAALGEWRQSQSLILEGQVGQLPVTLSGLSFEVSTTPPASANDLPLTGDPAWADMSAAEQIQDEDWASILAQAESAPADQDIFAQAANSVPADQDIFAQSADKAQFADLTAKPVQPTEPAAETFSSVEPDPLDVTQPVRPMVESDEPMTAQTTAAAQTEFHFSSKSSAEAKATVNADQDTTVRVSVRQLNELNDYFGDLTIERHRLDSEVKRLRTLVKLLHERLRSLEESEEELRDAYDKTASDNPLLLPAAQGHNGATAAGPTLTLAERLGNGAIVSGTASGFDSLEMDRYDERHLPFRDMMETAVRLREVADDIEISVETAEQSSRNLQRTTRQLQRNLNQLRMRPLSDITNRFPRALRELSLEFGKPVELKVEGDKTLVDRNILESLNDPLMHILRNAFDHGIETPDKRKAAGKPEQGTITIQAQQRSSRTIITIRDDGQGIPLDKIRARAQEMGLDESLLATASETDLLSLIFEPGFSTASQVTTLSGRGVGMDVVRNNLEEIRGDISVATQAGQGSTFTISVPYTLSVTRVLLAESNRLPMAIPTDNLQEITIVAEDEIYKDGDREMFTRNGQPIRLIRMGKWLAFNCARHIESLEMSPNVVIPTVLVFRYNEQAFGLQIERSWGEQEVALRRVEGDVPMPTGFNNCTIFGDGQVVPLLNAPEFIRWVLSCEGSNIREASVLYGNPLLSGKLSDLQPAAAAAGQQQPATILVVDDSVNVRRLLALTLEKQGYRVTQAKDGLDALEKLDAGLTINAIVCDIEMPRLDGYGFLAKLRSHERCSHIPITMLTSRTGDKHRQLAMKLGANAYFSKPYREKMLLDTLANAVFNAPLN
ncbi:hybrid sensor histidine kinase/response regulator [Leptolyngbya cf. ectocarpi LEGE 11479]|uniref:histidine kinase n=1 Tax=Leptolyngbya cf. ectocarpi LEGE 11479 TaxID=1828722 RepID=A0A928ZX95_LEPEC|nr:hybrid sensor histidine kinase/response regulator [Leptolyngbya ectocarpi]MBE9069090.1 hybrid sensor histidine kinase/response regulator [Leptolyngbya cf. ectocarpi LEGE 11479]